LNFLLNSGFLSLGLIGFIEDNEDFNEYAGTNIPSYQEQISFAKEYLKSKNPQINLFSAWDFLYFVADKSEKKKIKSLLDKFQIPINSKEGEKELGKILNFPDCCVEAHCKGNDLTLNKDYHILPFTPCSNECAKDWIKQYNGLAEKYKIDTFKGFLIY
jgi:hypothetical protein